MTTKKVYNHSLDTLWFAQNSLPLWLKWQLATITNDTCNVVICSKFITFVVEMTTLVYMAKSQSLLWFAQNSLPLWLKWQLGKEMTDKEYSCDLLKIHYLCGWNDNADLSFLHLHFVVICSKFITFVVEMTTLCIINNNKNRLWFAQNSLPLWLKWQQTKCKQCHLVGCDLLKIHYLCGWNDNWILERGR